MMNTFWALIFGLMGLLFGSFANVCIWRLPRGESISWPPSHCVHCQQRLKPWHLVPVFSWLILGGKCAMCGGRIAWRYPVVELTTGILFALIGWVWQISFQAFSYLILIFALIVAVGTDLLHREIPDEISLGASALIFILSLISRNWASLLGGVLLFSLLFLIALASRGGMGGGDIKLSLAIGLALGWRLGLVALFIAFFTGGILAVIMMFFRKTAGKAQVPFGPFLAFGAVAAMFLGEWIIQGYLKFSLMLWGW